MKSVLGDDFQKLADSLTKSVMFSDPQKNLEQFGITPGSRVADLGSGSGFYSIGAARMVGERGRVFAVDAQKALLEKLKHEAHNNRLPNIEALWGNVEKLGGTRLADASVDAVLACNILFQTEQKKDFPFEIKRILKPKGRVLVVDWKDSFGGMGPQPDHVVSQNDVRALFEKAGFLYEKEIRAGAHHFGLIFKRT